MATAVAQAVARSGAPVLRRYAHAKRVKYSPVGLDATIAANQKNFVFRNNTSQPIVIRAHADSGSRRVVVQLLGEPNRDRITLSTEKVRQVNRLKVTTYR